MARYSTTLAIAAPPERTFAYVSDFRHATWDPRVTSAERTGGDGPIGLGSTFVLRSPGPLGTTIVFPYRIVRFEPPRRVTLAGQGWWARWEDDLTITPSGDGSSLRYDARLSLRGVLKLGDPIMQILFKRIGDDATRGIPAAVIR
jgi:hypothetical protein